MRKKEAPTGASFVLLQVSCDRSVGFVHKKLLCVFKFLYLRWVRHSGFPNFSFFTWRNPAFFVNDISSFLVLMEPPQKKILFEASKISNVNTGLGQCSLHLGQAISKLNTDFDLTYLVPKSGLNAFGPGHRYIEASRWRKIFGVPADVAIWHYLYQGSQYRPVKKGAKVVVTIHDLNFLFKYKGWRKRQSLQAMQAEVTRADAVVAISHFTKGEILKHLSVDSAKVQVIYNGVKATSHDEKRPSFVKDGKFFFSLGQVVPKKNFHVLLPLLQRIEGSLVIAGNDAGSYANNLRTEIKKLGLSDRVLLTGEIPEEEKNWLYHNCEAFLFPSLAEGFGLPVIEAMRRGKPVFCSNLTSLPEVAGPYAYYFNDFNPDRMEVTMRTGFLAEKNTEMEKHRKDWASQFSWEETAKRYLAIYKDLIPRV